MANREPSLAALAAELADLRAAFAQQQQINAQQQAAISALQRELSQRPAAPVTSDLPTSPALAAAPVTSATQREQAEPPTRERATQRATTRGTSRRGLLRGAAAATAAATVATVALSATQSAHAAPLTTGGNVILGATNDADATTTLTNSASTAPDPVLSVQNTAGGGVKGLSVTTSAGTSINALDNSGGTGIVGAALGATGIGVYGSSNTGFGVVGNTRSGVDIKANGTGRILQQPQSQTGAPTTGTYSSGESIRDTKGDLWLCVTAGAPGSWVKVAHLAPGFSAGGATTYLSKPIRLFDSRSGATDARFTPGTLCTPSSPTTVQVSSVAYNGVTVPGSVAGAIGNVTVVNEQGSGYLELVPSGAGFTGAANLAFAPGQVISNAFNVGLSSTGALDIIIGSSATDVIIDLFAIVA
ncbi:MAG TPA: hypothetical protein VE338_15560 [Ktedonobacterales bacterium]|nr:hypothetical protein [Ktedonobacterales bacterium]